LTASTAGAVWPMQNNYNKFPLSRMADGTRAVLLRHLRLLL
jgi:hypothetical protein